MNRPRVAVTDKPSETLINKLEAKRLAAELNEREFAALLGISQGAWNQIRQGSSKPGLKFIAGVSRAYDDLDRDVMAFLKTEPGLMELWSQPIPA